MDLLMFFFVAIVPVISDGLTVHGPSGPLVAPLGSSVILSCFVDKPLPMENLKVEWRRPDSETLVHLFLDGKSQTEAQQQDYQDRAHFFTDQIQHGNFSLRLDKLRAEDEGQYKCNVYIQQESGETVVEIKDVERLLVSGSSRSISTSVGEDATLNCSVDSHIPPEHIEEISWKKTDEDGDILVLLYQSNKTLSDSSDEQYRNRVELFTAEIPKGNFSLRLKSVRTEDKGVYTCQVFAGDLSGSVTVELERLGFSSSHTMALILCITASGSALLLCFKIYRTSSPNEDTVAKKHIITLRYLHVFLPNIMMFVAFVLWGVTEGFLYEMVSCCALYILRPLMLIYVAPHLKKMSGEALFTQIIIFIAVYTSVLLRRAWESVVRYAESDKAVVLIMYSVVILFIVIGIICLLAEKKMPCHGEICKWIWYQLAFASRFIYLIFPTLQFALVYFAFGAARGGYYVSIAVPVFYFLSFSCLIKLQEGTRCLQLLNKTAWIIYMFIMNTVMIVFYITILANEKDGAGWICMAVFQQVLWMIPIFIFMDSATRGKKGGPEIIAAPLSADPTFKKMLYVFGSVGVVLLNSFTLMTELILKTVNGERAVGDLRIIVFSSESLFAFCLLILLMFGPWLSDMKRLQCCQEAARSLDITVTGSVQSQDSQNSARSVESPADGLDQNQNTAESHEMNSLLNGEQEANRSDLTETISVVSQI